MPLVARTPDVVTQHAGFSGWLRWNNVQCYGGRGGVEMPGLSPAPRELDLKRCMDLCYDTSGCEAVQVRDYAGGTGGCWLITQVDEQDCYEVGGWILYSKPRQTGLQSMLSIFHGDRGDVDAAQAFLGATILVLLVVVLILAAWYAYKRITSKRQERDRYTLTEYPLRPTRAAHF